MIQIRLWDDCNNHCSFCSLKHRIKDHSIQDLIERIDALIKIIPDLKGEVGLIGGELFLSSDPEFSTAWNRLVRAINESDIGTVYLATNLLGDMDLLVTVLFGLKKDVWVCTSYDEIGRFHKKEDKDHWLDRIQSLHDMGFKINCTMIPTQELIMSTTKLPEWLRCDLCEPIVSPEWYWETDKTEYHGNLILNAPVHLPRRKDMIKWFISHPQVLENYIEQEHTHANNILEFVDNRFERTYTSRFKNNVASCGHQYWSHCYADSDRCMMCDAKTIKG